MDTKFNTSCQICGKKYNYCSKCKELAGYRAVADSPECYQIYMVLRQYLEDIITESEATNMFSDIGITANSDLSHLLPSVARDVKAIINSNIVKVVDKPIIKTDKYSKNRK